MKNFVTMPFRVWSLWVWFVLNLAKHLFAGVVAVVLAVLAYVGVDAHLRRVYADPVETRYEAKLRKAREENREASKAAQEARWAASSEKDSRRDAERDLRNAIRTLRDIRSQARREGWIRGSAVENLAETNGVKIDRVDLEPGPSKQ